jgi:serine/threonine-protein kinase
MFPSTKFEQILPPTAPVLRRFGRYVLYAEIASGGMATVYLGRVLGDAGFARTVAVKRMHEGAARDSGFVAMLLDEAHLATRIRHPNVVPILDLVASEKELALVLEYVHGESLARLIAESRDNNLLPSPSVVSAVMGGVLEGLHAAHEAVSEDGSALGVVHRDVSPHNVVVGEDGVARVLDFGVAKATHRIQTTREGQIKGKLSYMAPEQVEGRPIDRRADVYAAGAVLWEMLTGRRLFDADNSVAIYHLVRQGKVEPPSFVNNKVPSSFDIICAKALARDPNDRFCSADEMSLALEAAVPRASARVVSAWVKSVAAPQLRQRALRIAELDAACLNDLDQSAPSLEFHNSRGFEPILTRSFCATRSDVLSSSLVPSDSAIGASSSSGSLSDSLRESSPPSSRRLIEAGYELLNSSPQERVARASRLSLIFPAMTHGLIGLVAGAAIVGGISLLRSSSYSGRMSAQPSLSLLSSCANDASLRVLHQADSQDRISIRFHLSPPDARVLADDMPVNRSLLLVPRSERTIRIEISAPGFRSRFLSVSAHDDHIINVDLPTLGAAPISDSADLAPQP